MSKPKELRDENRLTQPRLVAKFRAEIGVAETIDQLEEIIAAMSTQNRVVRDSLRDDWVKRRMELRK